MELTPKLLTEDVDFRVAYRGYDRDEVDDFLERVAVAVGQLQQQLTEAVARARSAESRLKAGPGAASAPEAAPAAPSPARAAEAEDLNEELRRTLVLAQRTADSAIREAREQAAQIRADAEERAQRTVTDAEAGARRKADEARTKLLAEIAELEGIRESMRGDVSVLERHLEEQRLQLRSSFQELQRLLDDPSSFRISPTPPLSGVAAPPASSPAPVRATQPAPRPAAEPAAIEAVSEPPAAAPEPEVASEPEPEPRPAAPEPEARATEPEARPTPTPSSSGGPPSGSVSFGEGAMPAGGGPEPAGDAGPRTQPVAAARFEEDDNDAFLAELRKAMADEAEASEPERGATLFDQDDRSRSRPRFGRRR